MERPHELQLLDSTIGFCDAQRGAPPPPAEQEVSLQGR